MAGNPLANMMGGNNPIASMLQGNPVMQVVNIMRNGGNPNAMLNQIMQKNPQMQQFTQMMNGKTPDQMGELMRNLAQQRGVDLGQLAQYMGMPQDVATKYGINMATQQPIDIENQNK